MRLDHGIVLAIPGNGEEVALTIGDMINWRLDGGDHKKTEQHRRSNLTVTRFRLILYITDDKDKADDKCLGKTHFQ